jgi:proline iminopeptidase
MKSKLNLILFSLLISSGCKSQNIESIVPVKYWNLSTGSHIAYISFQGRDSLRSTPIIFLHGGPGSYQVSEHINGYGQEWFEKLANNGFDVYLYDQVGSGLSARLSNPIEYTVDRHVEDIEAIRKNVGNKKIILIGSSFGASLAANYIASYPQYILKAVFVCPGYISASEWTDDRPINPCMTPEFREWIKKNKNKKEIRRYSKLDSLMQSNLKAAYEMAPDSEMDPLLDEFVNSILSTTVFDKDLIKEKQIKGMGWWSYTMICNDAVSGKTQPRQKLIGNQTPVLILRGDADYVPEAVANQYEETFPNSKFIRVKDAGHLIWLDQPEIYTREIEIFLNIRKN